jgi:hypothetical protein
LFSPGAGHGVALKHAAAHAYPTLHEQGFKMIFDSVFQVSAGLTLALAFGGMTFFSAVMAPLVFTKLPFDTAGAFIRQVFPWYYLTIGAVSALAAVLLLIGQAYGVALLAAVQRVRLCAPDPHARSMRRASRGRGAVQSRTASA